jgi:hypothetical protein
MRHAHNHRRKLTFEGLERRELMAGNVFAELSAADGRDLNITGDDLANAISITSISDDVVRISGVNGTTINGASSVQFTVRDDIRIDLQGGDDTVTVNNLSLDETSHADLNIELGAGRDTAYVWNSDVTEDIRVFGSTGSDYVFVDNVTVGADLAIELNGAGLNRFALMDQMVTVADTTVGDDLRIIGGASRDIIQVFGSSVNDNLDINTGGGADDVYVSGNSTEDLFVKTGSDKDDVDIKNNVVTDQLFADLGTSDDTLHLEGNQASRPEFIGGAGNDIMTFSWFNPNNFWANSYWNE